MNPLTNTRNITKLSQQELRGSGKTSWHDEYRGSAWIFIGGLPYELSEGDVLSVFSQYGEIVNINLCRDKITGKSKGFAFICYEDQRSTILAVDNFNGIKICNRTIRVDHVKDYKPPKDTDKIDDITRALRDKGCGPSTQPDSGPEEDLLPLPDEQRIQKDLKSIKPPPDSDSDSDNSRKRSRKSKKSKSKKSKKKKDKKSHKHKKRRRDSSSSEAEASSSASERESKRRRGR